MLKTIGNFITPLTVSLGPKVPQVIDLRGENPGRVALWATIENEVIGRRIVLLPKDNGQVKGQFQIHSGYVKWNRSFTLQNEIILASLWRGDDSSGSGMHGTQIVGALTKLHTTNNGREFRAPCRFDTVNMECISKGETKLPRYAPYGTNLDWAFGIQLNWHPSYTASHRVASDRKMSGSMLVSQKSVGHLIVISSTGEKFETEYDSYELNYSLISELIRKNGWQKNSEELQELLLSEDFVRNESKNSVQDLVGLYLRRGKVGVSELTPNLPSPEVIKEQARVSATKITEPTLVEQKTVKSTEGRLNSAFADFFKKTEEK